MRAGTIRYGKVGVKVIAPDAFASGAFRLLVVTAGVPSKDLLLRLRLVAGLPVGVVANPGQIPLLAIFHRL